MPVLMVGCEVEPHRCFSAETLEPIQSEAAALDHEHVDVVVQSSDERHFGVSHRGRLHTGVVEEVRCEERGGGLPVGACDPDDDQAVGWVVLPPGRRLCQRSPRVRHGDGRNVFGALALQLERSDAARLRNQRHRTPTQRLSGEPRSIHARARDGNEYAAGSNLARVVCAGSADADTCAIETAALAANEKRPVVEALNESRERLGRVADDHLPNLNAVRSAERSAYRGGSRTMRWAPDISTHSAPNARL